LVSLAGEGRERESGGRFQGGDQQGGDFKQWRRIEETESGRADKVSAWAVG
jgi:hypothetical protein